MEWVKIFIFAETNLIKYGSIHNQNLTKHPESTNPPSHEVGDGWSEGFHLEFFRFQAEGPSL